MDGKSRLGIERDHRQKIPLLCDRKAARAQVFGWW
jgi:hypothetical protein